MTTEVIPSYPSSFGYILVPLLISSSSIEVLGLWKLVVGAVAAEPRPSFVMVMRFRRRRSDSALSPRTYCVAISIAPSLRGSLPVPRVLLLSLPVACCCSTGVKEPTTKCIDTMMSEHLSNRKLSK